jgi:hypothetical protein
MQSVMPGLIRHPAHYSFVMAMDSVKASLRAWVKPGITNWAVLIFR